MTRRCRLEGGFLLVVLLYFFFFHFLLCPMSLLGFPGGSDSKESAFNARDLSLILG